MTARIKKCIIGLLCALLLVCGGLALSSCGLFRISLTPTPTDSTETTGNSENENDSNGNSSNENSSNGNSSDENSSDENSSTGSGSPGNSSEDSTGETSGDTSGETPKEHTHAWGEWETVADATCTAEGEKQRVCADDPAHIETESISMTAHQAGEWIVDEKESCDADGTKHNDCTVCGEVFQTETIPAYGHSYDEGFCTTCDAADPEYVYSQGLSMCLAEDEESYVVAGMGACNDRELVIPRMYNGKAVTGILSGAFNGCVGLIAVTLPSSITEIGADAFAGCVNLEGVYICNITIWITISFGNANANPLSSAHNLFVDGELLTELSVTGVTEVGRYAFYGCNSIIIVIVQKGVTSIGDYAFGGCDNLENVTVGEDVANVGKGAFDECEKLAGVYISNLRDWCDIIFADENANPLYYAGKIYINGVLATEITLPTGVTSVNSWAFVGCVMTSITLPDGVKEIEEGAFKGCIYLITVIIGGDVTEIGDNAFYGCVQLVSVTLPNSVKKVGNGAFGGCSSLGGVELGTGVEEIGDNAFYGCVAIVVIVIPENVKVVGVNVFENCGEIVILIEIEVVPEGWTENWTGDDRANLYDKEDWAYDEESGVANYYGEWKVEKQPDCENEGLEVRYAVNDSEAKQTRTIPALGHSLVHYESKEATCEGVGWAAYDACTRGDHTTYTEIEPLGHSLSDCAGKDATCLEVGWYPYQECDRCDYNTYVEIEPLGHSLTYYEGKAATCEEDGWQAYEVCDRCDYTTYTDEYRLGHLLTYYEGKAATCEEDGWYPYEECERCDYTTYTEEYRLGHSLTYYEGGEETCLEIGWQAYEVCDRCDYNTYAEIEPHGHLLTCYERQDATCGENGYEAYEVCAYGDYTTYVELEALGHSFENNVCTRCGLARTTLTGRVYRATTDGNATTKLSGATVTIVGTDNKGVAFSQTATTNSDGVYTLTEVPYGEYTATVSLDGYITNQATIGVTYNNVQAENLFLVYNGSSNGGNGSNSSNSGNGGESGENGSGSGNETQATGNVSGTVINATTGNALSGVVLTVYVRSGSGNTEGEVVYQTTTGTNGSYTLSSLPAGNYTLQFVDEREGISDAARYSTTTQNVAVLPDSTVSGQRVTVSNSLSVDSIRVVLTWGSTPNDLDSHLVISGSGTSYHIYYGDKSPSGADASLDVDDTTSYGPETITITAIKSGATYYYYVYNYSGGDYALANSNAKVTVYIGNEVFTLSVPSGSGLYWNVFSYNSDTGLVIVNQVSSRALA